MRRRRRREKWYSNVKNNYNTINGNNVAGNDSTNNSTNNNDNNVNKNANNDIGINNGINNLNNNNNLSSDIDLGSVIPTNTTTMGGAGTIMLGTVDLSGILSTPLSSSSSNNDVQIII